MLTPGDVRHGRAQRILGQPQPALRLAWTRHPERSVHRAPKPRPLLVEVSRDPPDAVLGNREKTLVNRERRTRSGRMGRLDEAQTGEWTQARWRLPVAMNVATEHGDHGTVRAVVVDSGLVSDHRRHRTPGPKRWSRPHSRGGTQERGAGDREHPSRACGLGSRATNAVFKAHAGACWRRFDPGAGAAGFNRLALHRLDREPVEPCAAGEVAVERVSETDDGGRK